MNLDIYLYAIIWLANSVANGFLVQWPDIINIPGRCKYALILDAKLVVTLNSTVDSTKRLTKFIEFVIPRLLITPPGAATRSFGNFVHPTLPQFTQLYK